MIAKLQGVVDYIDNDFIILNVNCVGYKIYSSNVKDLSIKDSISMWIETIVRDDSIRLFGFIKKEELDIFNKLLTVSGLGPKGALSVLTSLEVNTLINAININDYKTITSAQGIGKKMAEKIIYELQSKITNFEIIDINNTLLSDLLYALDSLGYKRNNVFEIAKKIVSENPKNNIEKLIPLVLKEINSK